MKKTLLKSLALAAVGSLFVAGSAMALPTGNTDSIDTTTLATMFTNAGSSINAANDDTGAELFSFQTSGATATYVASVSGATTVESFGLYDALDASNQLTLFDNSNSVGDNAQIYIDVSNIDVKSYTMAGGYNVIDTADFAGNAFGFYVNNGTSTYYSAVSDNNNQGGTQDNFLTYMGKGDNVTFPGLTGASDFGHWYIAANASSTKDSNTDNFADIVVQVESMQPVPEPATMLLLGTGLAGLAGVSRRRKAKNT